MIKRWQRRRIVEAFMKGLMFVSFVIVAGCLGLILWAVISKGLPALNWDMVTKTPKGGFYMGKEGGVLNAIIGSLYLASGGTLLALLLSLPIALYLKTYLGDSPWGKYVRLSLDVLWGIPSIVYGAFGFILMLALGIRASLLAGIIVLGLIELPIMVRAMDEVIRRMPPDLEHAALGDFHQEHIAVAAELCRHGDGEHHFEEAFVEPAALGAQLDVDFGRLALEVDLRGARHFERQILDVDLFDGEDGLRVFGHFKFPGVGLWGCISAGFRPLGCARALRPSRRAAAGRAGPRGRGRRDRRNRRHGSRR